MSTGFLQHMHVLVGAQERQMLL